MSIQKSMEVLISPNKQHLFVLDIDSTLVTTHQRNQAILNDWIKSFERHYPEDCLKLKQAQCQFGDYGLKSSLERIQYEEQREGAKASLDNFWRENFFSNNYLTADVATRGAVSWTQNLEEAGVEFVYLTARHKTTMWDGTLSSLDQLGFPINEDILFLKENLNDTDEEYKSKQLQKILADYPQKEFYFIDNEPVVLHRIQKDLPAVNLIWFESTHSKKMDPPSGVLKITDFNF